MRRRRCRPELADPSSEIRAIASTSRRQQEQIGEMNAWLRVAPVAEPVRRACLDARRPTQLPGGLMPAWQRRRLDKLGALKGKDLYVSTAADAAAPPRGVHMSKGC